MSEHGDLIEGIKEAMQQRFESEFVRGYADLPDGLTRSSRGYVWLEGFGRVSSQPIWEQLNVHVRFYRKHVISKSPENPVDPAPLYALGEDLRAALDGAMTFNGVLWLLTFQSVVYDHVAHGAEATVFAGHENRFETGETIAP